MNIGNNQHNNIEPIQLIDKHSESEYYIGISRNGNDSSSAYWQIRKITKTGTVWTFIYPDGNQSFNYIWDDRLSYFPSPAYPPVIEDGNTVGWYLSDDLTTITKDGIDFVSAWNDKLGSGHDLLQAGGSNQPKWVLDDGILFDGIDDWMKSLSFTFVQPEFIYIVIKQHQWALGDRFFDGDTDHKGYIFQAVGQPIVQARAGITSSSLTMEFDNFVILRVLFNGANSKLIQNDETPITGDFGTADMNGFTLAVRGATHTGTAGIQIKEIILRNVADAAQDEQDIYDYLANKYGL